jgi:hypothetical protein
MKAIRSLAVLALLSLAGCYRYTIVTGAPASEKTVGRNWQRSFIFGLVPPDTINTRAECPAGVAQFETQRSFLNSVVSTISQNLFTPITTKVTCASGPVPK